MLKMAWDIANTRSVDIQVPSLDQKHSIIKGLDRNGDSLGPSETF